METFEEKLKAARKLLDEADCPTKGRMFAAIDEDGEPSFFYADRA